MGSLMKKIVTFFCFLVLSTSVSYANLILHESFDDPNGTVGQLSAGATNTEDFFDGYNYEQTRWWTYSGAIGSDPKYIQVVEGSISYPCYQSEGKGNKAYLWCTDADDVRSFASQNVMSGKVYLGALIHVEAVKQKADADYFLSLGDHANSYFLGRLYAKSVKEEGASEWTGFRLGIAKNSESTNYIAYTEEVYHPNTDMLVVIEYEFVEGEKNDTARLYINPSKDTKEPTIICKQDTVNGIGTPSGANSKPDAGIYGIFGVFLREGINIPKVYIDEIKVATQWEDLWEDCGGEETDVENVQQPAVSAQKILRNGQLMIIRNEKTYSATGAEIH